MVGNNMKTSLFLEQYCKYSVQLNHLALRKKCPYSELFWNVFSCIRTEYGNILHISSHSVRMREKTDQDNSEYENFSRSVVL